MLKDKSLKIGLVGCGNISRAYLKAQETFPILNFVACTDLNMEAAKQIEEEFEVKAVSIDEIFKMPEIDIILNLTIPKAHVEINKRALENGKHAYCEKPFALNVDEGNEILELAKSKGLLTGCAPDTFLGAGLQTCRKAIDEGWIGTPISATAHMLSGGPESWHPNPDFFYEFGGGPMLDMGPYYITTLVHLLGPAKMVSGSALKAFEKRIITNKENYGKEINVEIPTSYSGNVTFDSGAVANIMMSFDVVAHKHSCIEIYGTEGSMIVPDPNTFGGEIEIKRKGSSEWKTLPYSHIYSENSRSIGLADMAASIIEKRDHRVNGEMANHVLDIMLSFEESSKTKSFIDLKTTCKQPLPFQMGQIKGELQ